MYTRRPASAPHANEKALRTAPYDAAAHDEVFFRGRIWTVTGTASNGKLRIQRNSTQGTTRAEIWSRKARGIEQA